MAELVVDWRSFGKFEGLNFERGKFREGVVA
jgi:hypothetical protein